MTAGHDKLDLARAALAEFAKTGRASDYFADDFVWDFSGFEGWVEDVEYHGPEGFDAQMARWKEPFERWTMEITELVDVGGDDVLAIGMQRGILAGSSGVIEMPLAYIATFGGGKLRRMRLFARHEHAYEAAGLTPPS